MVNTAFSPYLRYSCYITNTSLQAPLWSLRNMTNGITFCFRSTENNYLSEPRSLFLQQDRNETPLYGILNGQRFTIHTSWLTKTIQELAAFLNSDKMIRNPHYTPLLPVEEEDLDVGGQFYQSLKNSHNKIHIMDDISFIFSNYTPPTLLIDHPDDYPENGDFLHESISKIKEHVEDFFERFDDNEDECERTKESVVEFIKNKQSEIFNLYAQTHIIPLLSHPAP